MKTLNIFQAAIKLRDEYAHTGIELEATDCPQTNLYFIFHDALHTYLGAAPEEAQEPLVLATEMVLGGMDHTANPMLAQVTPDEISTKLAAIDADVLEILIDFYTAYFN
jgi:hypothetical protein